MCPSVNGLSVAGIYAAGGVAGQSEAYSAYNAGVYYTGGALSLTGTYQSNRNSTGAEVDTTYGLFGAYDFQVAKLTAAYMSKKYEQVTPNVTTTLSYIGVIVPVTPVVKVFGNYMYANNTGGTVGNTAGTYAAGASYAFSKMTTGYVMVGSNTLSGTSASYVTNLAAATAGKNQSAGVIGIRQMF